MVEIELKYSVIHIPTFQPPLQASAGTSAGDTALPLSQATRRGAGGGLRGSGRATASSCLVKNTPKEAVTG